jgi:hypothetical protein
MGWDAHSVARHGARKALTPPLRIFKCRVLETKTILSSGIKAKKSPCSAVE